VILAVLSACTGGDPVAGTSLLAVLAGDDKRTTTRGQALDAVVLDGTRAQGVDWSVAVDDGRLAVGMPDADQVLLVDDITLGGPPGSRFGAAVAWTPRGLLVGSPDADGGTTSPEAGAAVLFEGQEPVLILRGESGFDHLGEQVLACGDRIAVAAPWEQDALLSGAVHLVDEAEGEVPIASVSTRHTSSIEGAQLGVALACRDDEVLAGAPFDDGGADATGSVEALGGTLKLFGLASQDYAGSSIAVGDVDGDGLDEIAIGAFGVDEVRLYTGRTLEQGSRSPQFSFEGREVALADLNGDGFDEVITSGDQVSIWRGRPDLTGWPRAQTGEDADGTIAAPARVVAADVDQDGAEDLVLIVER